MTLEEKRQQLLALLSSWKSVAVAFSAGVDSSVVAKAARLALGDNAIAVTGNSASLASGQLEEAKQFAERIGIRHLVLDTSEFSNPAYVRNEPNRCYHCKTELYTKLEGLSEQLAVDVIVNGANADDLGDYRPGLQAATEHSVRSPLADLGFTKADVRALAAFWQLAVWDKPAMPCLSSRIAYGEQVTPERLAMVDRAEQFLRDLGLRDVRVRLHEGEMARIEVPVESISRLTEAPVRGQLVSQFREIGFQCITLDLEGFRSGSLNAFIDISVLRPDMESTAN